MNRRSLLRSLVAGMAIPLAPIGIASAAQRTGRRLILVELSGANDGLNTKIDKLLPKSRYAKYAIDKPIDFVKDSHGNSMMMSMMRATIDQTPTHIAGVPLKTAELSLWTRNRGEMPINELVLATNSYLYDPGTTSLDDLLIDPGYNLK